jgi:hypothetical protein
MTYDDDEMTTGRPQPRRRLGPDQNDDDHDDGATEGPDRGQQGGQDEDRTTPSPPRQRWATQHPSPPVLQTMAEGEDDNDGDHHSAQQPQHHPQPSGATAAARGMAVATHLPCHPRLHVRRPLPIPDGGVKCRHTDVYGLRCFVRFGI